jgi:GYF domain 2
MNSPEVFYLHIQGEQRGPYTIKHIDHLLNSGLITRDTLFWREGLEQWQPVTDLVELRKPRNAFKVPGLVLGGLSIVGFLLYLFGPITLDGWREIYQHDYTAQAAYWRGREAVRTHFASKGGMVSFEPFSAADVTLSEPHKASVMARGSLTDAAGKTRQVAWRVDLIFDPAAREWSALEVTELPPP